MFDVPSTWDDVDAASSTRLEAYLNASLDARPSYRAQQISGHGRDYDCSRICDAERGCLMERGYQYSWCPNTRVFQRVGVTPGKTTRG